MKKLALLFILIATAFSTTAQVTIGSKITPTEGILLELKEYVPDQESATADKGFLISRVKLSAKDNLRPLVENASDVDKINLTGTIVYNVTEIEGNSTTRSMKKGLYMWNGTEWTMIGKTGNPNFFYMPSFNLPLGAVGSTPTVNLYQEYVRQFKYDSTNNPNFTNGQGLTEVPGIYAQSDLYYVVLDYTPGVISNLQMDANGNLTYTVISDNVPDNAYINIICVVKD